MMRLLVMLLTISIPSIVISDENPCTKVMKETRARLGTPQKEEQAPKTGNATLITWQWLEKNFEARFMWYDDKPTCYYRESKIVPSYLNEPDGFRGIEWGTNIKKIEGLQFLRSEGKHHLYIKKKEDLKIGGAKLFVILYYFTNDLFTGVGISAKGGENSKALEEAMTERFGPGRKENEDSKAWIWDGQLTRMRFEIDYSGSANLYMLSKQHLLKKWAEEE
jgi:hypothetical protein